MASSDNLASYEPWSFRSSFPESWISEAYARDSHTLTRALELTSTISTTTDSNSTATCSVSPDSLTSSDGLSFNPFFSFLNPEITPITTTTTTETATTTTPTTTNPSTSTASNVSGSDPESGPKRQRNSLPGPTGRVSKRKSRATKKSQTTFITADPADFRRMVQQVTGVRFGSNSQMPVVSVLKPEAQRPGSRFQGSSGASGCLPTLDTSAFLLDHQQQQQPQQVVMMASGSGPGPVGPSSVSFSQPMVGGGGLDFDSFSSFPTLESFM